MREGMVRIENRTFGQERALYALKEAEVENCRFEGEEDGESFLKECSDVHVSNCYMDLRYPMWHAERLTVEGCEMSPRCRAALWYDRDLVVRKCKMNGIKAVRECDNVSLDLVSAVSPEFGWKCRSVLVTRSHIEAEYAFLLCRDLTLREINLVGKYSLQYCENVLIERCNLNTKDAFWHAKNVTVRDSEIDGEYLGWYSDGLTLINCKIKGTQPLCYCKNLRLIHCVTENCDLSFEYSEVEADIVGNILSVKNPLKGKIEADSIGEIIKEGGKYPVNAEILIRKNKE